MSPEFTPIASLLGGAIIGLSAAALMAFNGRIAGVSGIAARIMPPYLDDEAVGRLMFIAGLVVAPFLTASVTGAWPQLRVSGSHAVMIAAGLLVGFGSVWGNGCTSGHGICGLSRLSARSFAAVATFMATAIATVFLMRHVL